MCNANDPTQVWMLNENPPTISNADGNCISLGRTAIGVLIILDLCDVTVLGHEQWNSKPVAAQYGPTLSGLNPPVCIERVWISTEQTEGL
ncbi:hypothetical protein C8Q77DRAFT_1157933 [Trametes polyzona]|nr:hypothetical protein C8Q77DRAFT_1157933 [Trametes polyzona]